jgi:excisionase family DNA binding protein
MKKHKSKLRTTVLPLHLDTDSLAEAIVRKILDEVMPLLAGKASLERSGPKGESIEEAAASLGISRWTLRGEISAGRLRATRIGRRVVILHEAKEAWLAAQPVSASIKRAGVTTGPKSDCSNSTTTNNNGATKAGNHTVVGDLTIAEDGRRNVP